MSKTKSKALSAVLSVTTTIWLSGAVMLLPVANGQTNASIQDQINALMATIAQLQLQLGGSPASTVSTTNCGFTRNLTSSPASVGNDVKCLQQYLNASGNTVSATGAGSPGNETSYFGGKTKTAVKAWQAANGVSPTSGLFGPISRAKYNALLAVAPTPTPTPVPGATPTPVPGTVLSLAVASDNPMGATVPIGATAVNVLKFTVTGNGTLNGLTFKKTAIGNRNDISNVYLYEGASRLTSGRTINSASNEVSFANLALAVSGTRTLWLAIDIATTATAGNEHAFQLSASDGTPSVSGTLMGYVFKIGGQSAGVATTTKVGSITNPKVGQQGAQVSEFKISVSSAEDVELTSIAMTNGGSIAKSNLTNFVLKQNDVTIATALGFGAKDLVTLALSTPLKIEKGQEKTFKLYADVSGSTRTDDTIKLYFDSKTDINAKGLTYGFSISVGITDVDSSGSTESHNLTVQGGDVTITFNGPVSGDIARRAQDVTVYNFTIATKNAIEIKKLRFHATTTGWSTDEGYNDFKVINTSNNSVITSAVDITATSTDPIFTDTFTMTAGQSATFKVTTDVDADNDTGDTILVSLLAFVVGDIRNLDNNQDVAVASIVPNSTISGNTQTVKVPTLDTQLSSSPSSQTYVQGSNNVPLVGISFRAIASDVKLTSVKVTASSTSGTLTSGEIQNLKLMDGTTQVGDVESLDSSALTATFDNLSLVITKGTTKVLTVQGNISSNATDGDKYYVYVAAANDTNLSALDTDGNALANAALTGTAANSGFSVTALVTTTGNVSVATAPDDSDSQADVVVGNGTRTLAKFRWTATNEIMTVNKVQFLVVPTESATATSSASSDEVTKIKLYEADGTTPIGATDGYSVNGSGDESGIVVIESLGWTIPKDGNKVMVVKGVIPAVTASGGADSGASVYVSVHASNFEAQGANKDTSITAATGKQKVVYKVKPVFGALTAGGNTKLSAGTLSVVKFKIKAEGPEQIAWKQIQFKVAMTGATMTAVTAVPGEAGAVVYLKEVGSSNLNLASAFSSSATTTGEVAAIQGGNTGYVSLLLNAEQTIASGSEKEYELGLTFADVTGTVGGGSAVISLHRSETTLFNATTVALVRANLGTATDAAPSFVWSDYSDVGHSESTADWANGVLLRILPSNTVTMTNN
ncbi:MAG: peptidoglycan-binding domain-containing protein [bacterium]|nr:peptidoglycan-binding domain-containing protein [bacterium]